MIQIPDDFPVKPLSSDQHDTATEPEMFKTKFDSYVCEEDSIECVVDGVTYSARIKRDDNCKIDDDDCHAVDQSVTGCDDEQHAKLMDARRAWFNDEWFYCGIVLSAVNDEGWEKDYIESLWGMEANYPGTGTGTDTDNSYLSDIANQLLAEYLENLKNESS